MNRKFRRTILAAGAVTLALGAGIPTASATDRDNGRRYGATNRSHCGPPANESKGKLQVLVLTSDDYLLCFKENRPDNQRAVKIRQIPADLRIVGIDYRPLNGQLYAVTVGPDGAGRAFVVDPSTGLATLAFSIIGPALDGTEFGVDFNPAADRLRVISDTGQNLRIVPDGAATGVAGATIVDTPLKYAGAPANFGPTANVTAAAYTNNDNDGSGTVPAGSTGTQLYDIDTDANQLALQSPPNDGTLVPIGPLGVDPTAVAGFDLHSTIRDNTTVDVRGLAVLTVDGKVGLYSITPFSGRAVLMAELPDTVTDLAIPLNQL